MAAEAQAPQPHPAPALLSLLNDVFAVLQANPPPVPKPKRGRRKPWRMPESAAAFAAAPEAEQRQLLKNLLTVAPVDFSEALSARVDALLAAELAQADVVEAAALPRAPLDARLAMWRGDITKLRVDAIVNAANKYMLGCNTPNHPCIDNAIHCGAGPRLREACRAHMAAQGALEPTGVCTVTGGFALPARFVLHTVGPIADFEGHEQPAELAACYTACLDGAAAAGARSVAFCCISTGVFGYPQAPAAAVALEAVRGWLDQHADAMDLVVFNVFLAADEELYRGLLGF